MDSAERSYSGLIPGEAHPRFVDRMRKSLGAACPACGYDGMWSGPSDCICCDDRRGHRFSPWYQTDGQCGKCGVHFLENPPARRQTMTTRQQSLQDVIDQLIYLHEEGKVESIAFAIVQPDGVPIFGHANPSYSLLGAMGQAHLALGSTMLRDADDAPGFEPEEQDH